MKILKDVDLYEHLCDYDVTLIGTNIYGRMANGIELQIMLNYPYVYEKNLSSKYGDLEKLGTLLECTKKNEPTICLCFITLGNHRPDLSKDFLDYEALEKCLRLANILYKGKKVGTYLLGSNRFDGNGDRERILKIFENSTKNLDLTVHDYYIKSRYEQMKEVYDKEQAVRKTDREAYYKMIAKRKKEAEERFKKNGHRRY